MFKRIFLQLPYVSVALLGVLGISGHYLPLPSFLQSATKLLLASPTPGVFCQPEISAKIRLRATDASDRTFEKLLEPGDFGLLAGPLARKQPLLAPIFLPIPEEIAKAVYTYNACGSAPYLSPLLGASQPLHSITIEVFYPNSSPDSFVRALTFYCE